jgi:hypothetical protein
LDNQTVGALIVVAGLAAILIGAAVWLGLLGWFGNLPGDLRFESGNVRVYVPLVSMLLVSIALSLLLALLRRL